MNYCSYNGVKKTHTRQSNSCYIDQYGEQHDVLFYDAGHTAEDAKYFCDWALDARDDATIAIHDYKPNEEVWKPSAVVMDEYKIQTGRSTMLVGSLFIATHEPIPYADLLGTEDHPYENIMLDANV